MAEITPADIGKLSKRQRDALGLICINEDGGLHPKTLEALERKGFIKSFEQTLGGRFSVRVKRYTYASIGVHMAWCWWASTHVEDDE